ncbi:MAG: hypothetical protein ACRD06_07435 [Terriglobia bacterium]
MLLALGVFLTGAPRALRAQTLLTNALSWFPQQTIALEYSNTSALRSLPDYASLRSHFLGKNLRTLEGSLAQIGIHEDDVDQMVLGWQSGAGKDMRYEGIATGEFSAESVARQAAVAKIPPHPVAGFQAYCFPQDPNRTCVAVVDGSLGVFGPLPYLEGMLKARTGDGPSIASNAQFTKFVRDSQSDAPIWGVALGPAVSKWFKAWMPGEKNLQMDWAAAFKDVRTISYEIEAGDNVHLNVKLDCASLQAASSVRQLLEGMKLVQQMAWQSSNPGQSNPFQNVTVEVESRQVSFKLTAAYAALERAGPLGHL